MRRRRGPITGVLLALVTMAAACGAGGDRASSAKDAAASTTAAEGEAVALATGVPVQASRSIIATAELVVEVADARSAAAKAAEVAAAAGGFLSQQDAQPGEGVVRMTLRVPTEEFEATMARFEGLGDVQSQRIDTQDVTDQVVDLEGRIASARVSVERVRQLLERSGDVTQLATVEGELARREADLESLLGRQRVLDDQVALATIGLELRGPHAESTRDEPLPGFFGGVRRGWDGFVIAASVAVTGLGYALPFLGVALLVVLVALRLRRRLRAAPPNDE